MRQLFFLFLAASVQAQPTASVPVIPDAVLTLHDVSTGTASWIAEAAPPRFVRMKDGTIFVGGSSGVARGQLRGQDAKQLDALVSEARKGPMPTSTMTVGPGDARYRLSFLKDKRLTVLLQGTPTQESGSPIVRLVARLLRFDHSTLRPFAVTSYQLGVRERELPGGCRRWPFQETVDSVRRSSVIVPASSVPHDWPTGALPASICGEGKRVIATLRPLLPGEHP